MDDHIRPHHMIAIVAENGVDAISPAFDQRLAYAVSPAQSTAAAAAHAIWRRSCAMPAGLRVDGLLSARRPQALPSQLQAVLQQRHDEPWLINLSGANPALAALLYQLASQQQIPAFVIGPETDKAVWLIRPPAIRAVPRRWRWPTRSACASILPRAATSCCTPVPRSGSVISVPNAPPNFLPTSRCTSRVRCST